MRSTNLELLGAALLAAACGQAHYNINPPSKLDPFDTGPARAPETPPPPPNTEPTATAPASLPEEDLLTLVASSTESDFAVAPLPDGAFIASRSLFATVVGAEVRQDPRWLAGLPEYVNWDAGLSLQAPASGVASRGELPKGAFVSMIAGNTHGAGGEFVWNGARWVKGRLKRDARIEPLFENGHAEAEAVELSTGEALVVKLEEAGWHSYAFEARQKRATRVRLPLEKDLLNGLVYLTAASLRDATFCTTEEMAHFDGAAWTLVPLPEKTVLFSCVMTRDGAVWINDNGKLLRRTPAGEWRAVVLPPGSNVKSLAASGERLWVMLSAEDHYELRSTTGVGEPSHVGPDELPLVWFTAGGGITGVEDFVPDVPSVSANPSGPGTPACRSLVVYLGRTLTPEIRRAIAAVPDASSASLVEVRGREKGRLRYVSAGGRSEAVVDPSPKRVTAFALIPADYARGKTIAHALSAQHLPSLQAKLLCAVPEVVRKLPKLP